MLVVSQLLRTARLTFVAALGIVLALSILSAGATTGSERLDLLILLTPVIQRGALTNRFPQGSHLARLGSAAGDPLILTPDFFAAADPRISFDGTRILFAGKKSTGAHWQVWEMNADGSKPRQVTRCSNDCMQPAYLPREEVVFTTFFPGSPGLSSQLAVSKLDGSSAQPITFGPGDFQVETVLKDGRILATARSPLLPANGLIADRELYTLRPDGTGLATLRCDHQHPAIRSQAQELDDGAVVFVKASLSSRTLGGDLAWIRRGALQSAPLTVSPDHALSPQATAADELLVAREPAAGHATGNKLALYPFDAARGRFGTPVYEDAKLSAVEAVPMAAHETPRGYWSTLNPDLHRGYFICLDGNLAEGIHHGRIAAKLTRVRLLTLDAATHRDVLLGEAPMEEDGSFYIAVPPDQPVRFEVLDAAGRMVRAQRSWIWARSGEEHGCVGCHEDRAQAPENRWPMALRRFDTPTRLDLAKGQ
jgi:hypothetical protein